MDKETKQIYLTIFALFFSLLALAMVSAIIMLHATGLMFACLSIAFVLCLIGVVMCIGFFEAD